MVPSERTLLLAENTEKRRNFTTGLSVCFATICIVDVFGVFPIISLPKTIIDCGFYGIFVVGSICGMQIYTANLLGRCWLIAEDMDPALERKNRYPYVALAKMTYGPNFSKLVTFLVDVTIFGGGIPNLILASQNLQLLGLKVSDDEFNLSSCYWIIILGTILCPLLWLGSPKDMKLLCLISVGMVLTVFVLVWGCIVFDFEHKPSAEPQTEENLWKNILVAYGILAFQFDIHPTILTIQVDMNEKNKIGAAAIGGFTITVGMFALTTIGAALRYGHETHRSLLGTLPPSIALHFAALLVALQLCLTSAISNNALYQHIEDTLGISREFNYKRCLLRTSLSFFAIFLAESVPRLDVAMSLIGGTFIGPLVFILPPLIFMKIRRMKKDRDKDLQLEIFTDVCYNFEENSDHMAGYVKGTEETSREKLEGAFCIFIILFGIFSTVGTSYINILSTIGLGTFSQPCLYNLTTF